MTDQNITEFFNKQVEKTNRALLVRHLEKDHNKRPDIAHRNVEDRFGHLKVDDPV